MKANKRIRDLKRESDFRLTIVYQGLARLAIGVTTYPSKDNNVRITTNEHKHESNRS